MKRKIKFDAISINTKKFEFSRNSANKEVNMFKKVGSPQIMTVIDKCCICGKSANIIIDGILYCTECFNKKEIDKPIEKIEGN